MAPGLAAYTGLAFLSAGLLIGSYADQSRTVYVYVVNEGGQNVEYPRRQCGQHHLQARGELSTRCVADELFGRMPMAVRKMWRR